MKRRYHFPKDYDHRLTMDRRVGRVFEEARMRCYKNPDGSDWRYEKLKSFACLVSAKLSRWEETHAWCRMRFGENGYAWAGTTFFLPPEPGMDFEFRMACQ